MSAWILCIAASAIDGDGLRCALRGGKVEEVRLLAIDAPDYSGSRPCREGRAHFVCDDRRAEASKASLRSALKLGPVRVMGVGRDRYGRLLARATAGGRDLSCWQLARGQARYVARWDDPEQGVAATRPGARVGRVAATCPAHAR